MLEADIKTIIEGNNYVRIGMGFKKFTTGLDNLINELLTKQQEYFKIPSDRIIIAIKEPEEIFELLEHYLLTKKREIFVYSCDNFHLIHFNPTFFIILPNSLVCKIDESNKPQLLEKEYLFVFGGYNALYFFYSRFRFMEENNYIFSFPENLYKISFRHSPRIANLPKVKLKFNILNQTEKNVLKTLENLSCNGISFRESATDFKLALGEVLPDLILFVGERQLPVKGIVKSIRTDNQTEQKIFGLETQFDSKADLEFWKNLVLKYEYTHIEDIEMDGADSIWQIFDKSRYLNEATPELLPSLKEAYFKNIKKISYPNNYIRIMAFRAKDTRVGTMSIARVYHNTWWLHSLAINHDETNPFRKLPIIAKELFIKCFTVLNLIEDCDYIIGIAKQIKRNYQFYGNFFKHIPDKTLFYLFNYEVLKYLSTENQSELKIPDIDAFRVVKAEDENLEEISEYLKKSLTTIEYNAMAYSIEDIQLNNFNNSCNLWGGERNRNFYFIKSQGKLLGFSSLESASLGVNIFNSFDCCRIYLSEEDNYASQLIKKALLAHAITYFKQLKKKEFIYYCTDEDYTYSLDLGFRFVSKSENWIISRKILPEYLNYLTELFERNKK